MTTANLVLSRSFPLLAKLQKRWRWSQLRRYYLARIGRCPELQADAGTLLRHGYKRVAICIARMQLERAIEQAHLHVAPKGNSKLRNAVSAACYLRGVGAIDHATWRRVVGTYRAASRVVHGGGISDANAQRIVAELQGIRQELSSMNR